MLKYISNFIILVFILDFSHGFSKVDNVQKVVDISSQLVRVSTVITLNDASESSSFIFVSDQLHGKLAYLSVSSNGEKLNVKSIPSQSNSEDIFKQKYQHFSVSLNSKTKTLNIEEVYVGALEPYPEKITQSEPQFVLYKGNHYYVSPYEVVTQTTTVKLASSKVESYTKLKPSQLTDSTLKFGPYANIAPYTDSALTIHSENNSPFLVVTDLVRTLEVSHWGFISVEETIDIHHAGAQLQGVFSRLDYQRQNSDSLASVANFDTSLPASATNVYYRDDIGNVSTSNMRRQSQEVSLELRPRFPLFGGWNTHYTVGYQVPVYEYLYRQHDRFVLKMRLLDHIFDNVAVERMTLKVLLPEGVGDVRLVTPYPVQRQPDTLFPTYLDTTGRLVLTLTASHLVDEHIQEFAVEYRYASWQSVREPLMVSAAFMALFLCVIVYTRLDFRLSDCETAAAGLGGGRLAAVCSQLLALHRQRSGHYQRCEDALAESKRTRDAKPLAQLKRGALDAMKSVTKQMVTLAEQLRADSPALADRLLERLVRADDQLRLLFTQHMTLLEKLVAGKLDRAAFIDQEQALTKQKEELVQKMDEVAESL